MESDSDMLQFEARVRRITEGYITFVLCTVGVLCNCLAFMTFSTKAVRTSTTSVYLRALAVADICVLVTALMRYKTYKLFLNDQQELDSVFHTDAYIEVYVEPFHWLALGSSSFITIALSLERYLAVRHPLMVKRTCSTLMVMLCILVMVTLVMAITAPNLASYSIQKISFFGEEVSVATLTEFGRTSLYPCTYHNYVVPILWYIIPAVILTLLNILLSMHVQKSSRIRVGLPHIQNPNRKLTLIIILIVCGYMGCNFPKCIFMFYKLVNQVSDDNVCITYTSNIGAPNTKAYLIIEVITEILNILNSCVNFLLYCLVGSRFRRELKKIITCQWHRKLNSGTFQSTSQRSQRSLRYKNEQSANNH